jgi:cell division protein FtsA
MPIPRSQLLAIIRPRIEEILKMVKDKLDKLSLARPLGGGIVLTGGGAQLLGVSELSSHIFRLPVRVGIPLSVGGLVEEYRNPIYATAVGLVLEGEDRERKIIPDRGGEVHTRERSGPTIFGRLVNWIRTEFF